MTQVNDSLFTQGKWHAMQEIINILDTWLPQHLQPFPALVFNPTFLMSSHCLQNALTAKYGYLIKVLPLLSCTEEMFPSP